MLRQSNVVAKTSEPTQKASQSFFSLTPSQVLDVVEEAIQFTKPGVRLTGRAVALNSLENRVTDIECDDGSHVVTKFYRPARWTRQQIADEHKFLFELKKNEIPVVAPISIDSQQHTIGNFNEHIMFAIFPKVRGRILDELSDLQLQTLGRYLARLHAVGKTIRNSSRLPLNIQTYGIESFNELLNCKYFEGNSQYHFERVAERFLETIDIYWDRLQENSFLLHGDCHLGNVLWDGDNPFFLDFDDSVIAPAVQDVWMVVRGRDQEAQDQREVLIDAYCEMHPFAKKDLELIEPLRGLRMIHYAAWIARRWDDPSFKKAFPLFGTSKYWQEEIEALEDVCERCLENEN